MKNETTTQRWVSINSALSWALLTFPRNMSHFLNFWLPGSFLKYFWATILEVWGKCLIIFDCQDAKCQLKERSGILAKSVLRTIVSPHEPEKPLCVCRRNKFSSDFLSVRLVFLSAWLSSSGRPHLLDFLAVDECFHFLLPPGKALILYP